MATPIQSYTGHATDASKSIPTMLAPSSGYRSASATPSALSENALVWNAVIALSARRRQEPTAERILGRERNRVQHAVDPAPALLELTGDGLEVVRGH